MDTKKQINLKKPLVLKKNIDETSESYDSKKQLNYAQCLYLNTDFPEKKEDPPTGKRLLGDPPFFSFIEGYPPSTDP